MTIHLVDDAAETDRLCPEITRLFTEAGEAFRANGGERGVRVRVAVRAQTDRLGTFAIVSVIRAKGLRGKTLWCKAALFAELGDEVWEAIGKHGMPAAGLGEMPDHLRTARWENAR